MSNTTLWILSVKGGGGYPLLLVRKKGYPKSVVFSYLEIATIVNFLWLGGQVHPGQNCQHFLFQKIFNQREEERRKKKQIISNELMKM